MPAMPKGVKLDLKVWLALKKRLPEIADTRVRVGVLADKGGTQTQPGSKITMLELAAIHEFGAPAARIPERSFIRSTFERPDVMKKIQALAAHAAKKMLASGPVQPNELALGLGAIGAYAVGEIRKTVKLRLTTGPEPQRLADSTINRRHARTKPAKRFRNVYEPRSMPVPLFDTGRLLNAVSWVVVRDGKKKKQ